MKRLLVCAALAAVANIPLDARAQASDLTVAGSIRPASCTPNLEGGVIDYGDIGFSDLFRDQQTSLPVRSSALVIACDSPVAFHLRLVDSVEDTAVLGLSDSGWAILDRDALGMGSVEGVNIGAWVADIAFPRDQAGEVHMWVASDDNGGSWQIKYNEARLNSSQLFAVNDVNLGSAFPAPHQMIRSTIRVKPHVRPSAELPLKNSFSMNGRVTLEIYY